MKSAILTGLSLTLFMLLLVVTAAVVFLFQGRQTLQERVARFSTEATELEQDLVKAGSNLEALEATRAANAVELATAESDVILLEGQLVESQQTTGALIATADALATDLDETNERLSQLALEREEALQRPPQVTIIAPEDGVILEPGEVVDLVAVASDAAGVTAVSLTVDGQPIDTYPVENEALVTIRDTWTADGTGLHTISAAAVNSNELTSNPVTITVQVIDLEAINLATLSQLEENVVQVRGQSPLQPVAMDFIDREEWLQQSVAALQVTISPEDLPRNVLTLAAFDFVDIDFDLAQAAATLQDELGESVHSASTTGFLVVTDDGELSLESKVIHVREYIHVLQDQHHQLAQSAGELDNSDARDAFHAFMEGEAELVYSLYLEHEYFTAEEIASLSAGDDPTMPDTFPAFLIDEWLFPRTTGLTFAQVLYDQGGDSFSGIDAAWENLPSSTEQILHPDQYEAGDSPDLVTLPVLSETLGAGWELVEEDVLGEFYLRQYLRQQLNEDQADRAVAGWGGDRYNVFWREADGALVMVLRLTWDTALDRAEFANIYTNYPARHYEVNGEIQASGGECWQGEDVICFYPFGDETVIVRAPDIDLATDIAEKFEGGE